MLNLVYLFLCGKLANRGNWYLIPTLGRSRVGQSFYGSVLRGCDVPRLLRSLTPRTPFSEGGNMV